MYKCFAATSFGLESQAAFELKRAGFSDVQAQDARVYFSADERGIFRANLFSRCIDRIYLEIAQFQAVTFSELFDQIASLPWENYIPKDAAFPVLADSVHSTLKSVSDIQAIGKKAVVSRLQKKYHISYFPESKERFEIMIKILKDTVTVALNTSGPGLNRRGYRRANTPAPLRETLAAGILSLKRYRGNAAFYDPMCGSGTFVIEAALKALEIPPGFKRNFDIENWRYFHLEHLQELRQQRKQNTEVQIFASDIDKQALKAAKINAREAGVEHIIQFRQADVRSFEGKTGLMIANPPYAMRMGERTEVHELYRAFGTRLKESSGLDRNFLCADDEFERYFGKRADKKRKLYNGNIRCTLYTYTK